MWGGICDLGGGGGGDRPCLVRESVERERPDLEEWTVRVGLI